MRGGMVINLEIRHHDPEYVATPVRDACVCTDLHRNTSNVAGLRDLQRWRADLR